MSRVVPPRTVKCWSSVGSSSLIVLCDSLAGLPSSSFRPADAGRTDQTDQTDVRSISGSGRLDLCVLVNDMFFPVSDAASVAGQWLAAGVMTMADVFGIPWQLLAVPVIYTTAKGGPRRAASGCGCGL